MLKPEHVPISVIQKLRRMVYDFETNEAVLIAAAINAWPGGEIVDKVEGDDVALLLPLTQESGR